MVNVIPLDDIEEHVEGRDCRCLPAVARIDPETGQFYPNGPLITHFAFDGRDAIERLTGQGVEGKQWGTFVVDNPPLRIIEFGGRP